MKCCATCETQLICPWIAPKHAAFGCEFWKPDAIYKAAMLSEELRRQNRWYRRVWRFVRRAFQGGKAGNCPGIPNSSGDA